jgi:hypothetical protein
MSLLLVNTDTNLKSINCYSFLFPGVKLADVYDGAVALVKQDKPAYVDKLTKSIG